MPFLLALTTVSTVLWKLFGASKSKRNEVDKQTMKIYREEFIAFFPTILTTLVNKKASHPRVKVAYDHLEEVSCLSVCTSAKVVVKLVSRGQTTNFLHGVIACSIKIGPGVAQRLHLFLTPTTFCG